MVLQQLQSMLARLYAVPNDYAVADYLVTDRTHAGLRQRHATDEQVLVNEAEDGLRIGVYVAEEVLQRLANDNPIDALSDTNIADYCTALEVVSHLPYLTWRAARSDSFSLLELELQADVDKYVAALCLFTAQCNGRFPKTLHERLFHRVRYHADLDEESSLRYRAANRYAARYCRRLDERYLTCRRTHPEAWLQELRSFYRLTHAQKLRRVVA